MPEIRVTLDECLPTFRSEYGIPEKYKDVLILTMVHRGLIGRHLELYTKSEDGLFVVNKPGKYSMNGTISERFIWLNAKGIQFLGKWLEENIDELEYAYKMTNDVEA